MADEILTPADEAIGGLPTSTESIIEMLENADLTEDLREQLRSIYGDRMPKIFGYSGGTTLAFLFAFIIFAIISFFGYKLYKSIKDKELKKEQKKETQTDEEKEVGSSTNRSDR